MVTSWRDSATLLAWLTLEAVTQRSALLANCLGETYSGDSRAKSGGTGGPA